MKLFIVTLLMIVSYGCTNVCSAQENKWRPGLQPQLSKDNRGVIRMVYGAGDTIFCATSSNNGQTFSNPKLVAVVKDMHLGMSRGPQLASSANYSMVAAVDKKGSVHTFCLSHSTGKWTQCKNANDVANSAPEGLMNIAADEHDNFYAVWLDIRNDKTNNICFAKTTTRGRSWSPNKLVYISPDKHVCECCKPTITVRKSDVYIQFRNWLNGSRDLYLLSSTNGGEDFNQPVKLGDGTWKLNACPMDGGGLVVNDQQQVTSVWRRENKIYLSKPGETETEIASGRNCSITNPQHPIITWQEGDRLKVKDLNKNTTLNAGKGGFIKAVKTNDDKIFCAWEADGQIIFARL
ncbi:hypothetical protein QWZ08_06235 [Ferruginibacter paludis]|uniref:hypothetical protein n=1 Tax=Ferruginibacter paludis TaxID=1310417 RepID=UPI0025B382B0|nr:hypothetical protein [Ferruginibacter paludis]MDN3655211.1 hypothetical protein [Ferruginibacter paludis]